MIDPHVAGGVDSFLGRATPLVKLLAFFLLLFLIMNRPSQSPSWWVGAGAVVLAIPAGGLAFARVGRAWWRLRWLFLVILLLHGLFTPGHSVVAFTAAVTVEGVFAGLEQMARLALLVGLALVLAHTTPAMTLATTVAKLCGHLPPVRRGLALFVFALGQLGRLFRRVGAQAEQLNWRLGPLEPGLEPRLRRLALAASGLLRGVFAEVRDQHLALRVRGYDHELPLLAVTQTPVGWRDGVLLLLSGAGLFL